MLRAPSQIPPRFLVRVIAACSQLLLKSVSKLFENVEWSISPLRYFKIQTLLKINCCMAAISAFRATQHSQIFSLFFRNRIQCIALYQLHNSQALLNLRRGYYSNLLRTCFKSQSQPDSIIFIKATFHLTISMPDQRATGKIQRNNYRHGSCGPSLTGNTSSVSLIFTHGTHRNVKNR